MVSVTESSATEQGSGHGPDPGSGSDLVRSASRRAARPFASARSRVPPAILIGIAVGVVIVGQLVEDLADSQPLQMLTPIASSRRWTLIAVVIYELVIARILTRTVQRSLPSLKRVLRIDSNAFRGYVHQMEPPDLMVSAVLLAASALITVVLFGAMGLDLPLTNDPITNRPLYLSGGGAGSVAILAGYTVVGWAGLRLIYVTVRVGRALGAMCREPLEVDVFDTSKLLPFGNIALASALAPVGIIVILLVGLGQPTNWLSWTVLLLAAIAGLLALLLPLRGIHAQMADAKDAVLADLNARIRQVYDDVSLSSMDVSHLPGLNERTNTLLPLRKTVGETTTWPFADTVAFGRAILIASAPLIYTVLSELIKVFWINPLSR